MKNLVLFGFMGSGKSTIGRLAAAELKMPFIDVDAEIEHQQKSSISEIFEKQGETTFRDIESQLIEDLSKKDGVVIATGGGAILRQQNVDHLKKNGIVVFLHADEETILRRTSSNQNRPLLKGNARENIRTLMNARAPLYAALPYQVETGGRTSHQVLNEVMRIYRTS
jgi:shikimate kinase